jgi:hypothetical protein
VRDIKSEDLVNALQCVEAEQEIAAVTSSVDLIEVLNSLNHNVRAGRVPLFVCISENYRFDSILDTIIRFAHLTFQEFLAGRFITKALTLAERAGDEVFEKKVNSIFTNPSSEQPLDRLHEAWWLQVIMFAGGTMGETPVFEKFAKVVLLQDDASGANACMVKRMLTECSPNNRYVRRVTQLVNEMVRRMRPYDMLAKGLCHPSLEMRNLVLTEIKEFQMDPEEAAHAVLALLDSGFHPWYTPWCAAQSLGQLQVTSDLVMRKLMAMWNDRTLPMCTRQAAVCAIGALDAQNHPSVCQVLLEALVESEASALQALVNVRALRVTSEDMVRALLKRSLVATGNSEGDINDVPLALVVSAQETLCWLLQECSMKELPTCLLSAECASVVLLLYAEVGERHDRAVKALEKLVSVVSSHPNDLMRLECLKVLLNTFICHWSFLYRIAFGDTCLSGFW